MAGAGAILDHEILGFICPGSTFKFITLCFQQTFTRRKKKVNQAFFAKFVHFVLTVRQVISYNGVLYENNLNGHGIIIICS